MRETNRDDIGVYSDEERERETDAYNGMVKAQQMV